MVPMDLLSHAYCISHSARQAKGATDTEFSTRSVRRNVTWLGSLRIRFASPLRVSSNHKESGKEHFSGRAIALAP
jgi:hypothetical protein